MSVWEIQAGEDGASLFAISIVDSTDHIGSDDSPESDTRRHAVVLETDILKIVKHLPRIQEGRHFKISRHAGDLRPDEMNPLFDAGRDQMLVDKAIDAVAAEIVLSSQRTLFKKRHL